MSYSEVGSRAITEETPHSANYSPQLARELTKDSPVLPNYREQFPLLRYSSVAYLDSAATAQKPECVIGAVERCYREQYSNIHRGVYPLSVKATAAYEEGRGALADFLGAKTSQEIVFTSGATEAINLVAYSWGRRNVNAGDEILVSLLEHHSNFVPWQMLASEVGAVLRFVGLTKEGHFDWADFEAKLSDKTKLVAITQLANGLGVAPPLEAVIEQAHRAGALVLIDGAQGAAHLPLNLGALDVDFYACSGHKLYGPTGIGALYAKRELLEEMPPFLAGGDMIRSVSVRGTEFNEVPAKFEAGTPNIAGVSGLTAAISFINNLGVGRIKQHEDSLVELLETRLSQIPEVRILGPTGEHHGLVCFLVQGIHPHDLAQFLSDRHNTAVRAGHHCAQPLLEHLGVPASTRISFGVYNRPAEVELACQGIREAIGFFGGG